jgi:hypothetical protein
LPIAPEIITVLPLVAIVDGWLLREATNHADLIRQSTEGFDGDYGMHSTSPSAYQQPGEPRAYMIETQSPRLVGSSPNTLRISKWMRVAPLPDRAYAIQYECIASPPTYTVTHLGTLSNPTDTSPTLTMPHGWEELYLLPVARQRFTASPFFDNARVRDEFARQYKQAIEGLKTTRPSRSQSIRLISAY